MENLWHVLISFLGLVLQCFLIASARCLTCADAAGVHGKKGDVKLCCCTSSSPFKFVFYRESHSMDNRAEQGTCLEDS